MIGRRLVQCGLALALVLSLAGCGSRGVSLEDVAVDRSIVTGSITPAKPPADQLSDEVTIRNAVSSADIQRLGSTALPWANVSTGSQGSITGIAETRANGVLCRAFTTTRESFRGVAIYAGEACQGHGGEWLMRSFTES